MNWGWIFALGFIALVFCAAVSDRTPHHGTAAPGEVCCDAFGSY